MNKSELIAAIAAKNEISKAEAARCVEYTLCAIADNICYGDALVAIPDFGRFYVKHVAERKGKNPQTGEEITIAERDKVVFKPSDNISIYTRKHGLQQ